MPKLTLSDEQTLHYLDIGRGPVCLLIHGFGMQAEFWLPQVLPLLNRHRFIIPSLRGWGRSHSAKITDSCVASVYAKDMLELVTHLGLANYTLAGYSMGAVTAMRMQQLGGFDNIRRYIHIDQSPVIKNRDDWPWGLMAERQAGYLHRWRQMLEDVQNLGTNRAFTQLPKAQRQAIWEALSEFMQETFHQRTWRSVAIPLTRQDAIMRRALPTKNWQAYIQCMAAYVERDYDFLATMADEKTPVTIFAGADSTMYPLAGQQAFQAKLQNAELVEFPNCGHGLVFEAPLKLSREMAKALAK